MQITPTSCEFEPFSAGASHSPRHAPQMVSRPTTMAPSSSPRINAPARTAAQPESRKFGSGGAGRGGRLVRGIGTSPGWRTVRGAARVSAAVARQVAQVRVDDGEAGWIGERVAAQWPPAGGADVG